MEPCEATRSRTETIFSLCLNEAKPDDDVIHEIATVLDPFWPHGERAPYDVCRPQARRTPGPSENDPVFRDDAFGFT
jgi:hypothetical protein